MISDYGKEYSKKYLEANEEAINNIRKIIQEEQIECELHTQIAYVYATQQDEVLKIEKEVDAVKQLGKNAEFVKKLDLPFEIKGAIKFENQAQFHPRKYMLGLSKKILERNKIYN